jgi:hypothetical protein
MSTNPSTGVICLANDRVLEHLIALCRSLRKHDPELSMTVVPFDNRLDCTRAVVADFGYDMFDGLSLAEMDRVGSRYWPDGTGMPHIMRKFCAFWAAYQTFLFLDADIVVLCSLKPYFDAFERSKGDFMYFATDVANVYRPGPVRERFVRDYATAGFNSGTFLSRRGALSLPQVARLVDESAAVRSGFVDNLEQSFLNFSVDTARLSKINASDAVRELVCAGALMRIRRGGGAFRLADARMAETGRDVSMIHWAGYRCSPFMPYRTVFLDYRLGDVPRFVRMRFELSAVMRVVRETTLRQAYHTLRRTPFHVKNWLAARGYVSW